MSDPQQDERDPVAPLAARLADLKQDEAAATDDPAPEAPQPETAGLGPQRDGAPHEPETRPTEGYDSRRQAWIKTFSLGASAPLHELGLDDAAGHEAAAGLSDGASRAAQDAGYTPTGAPELIDVRRNGLKSDLTYAVPAAERG